MATRTQSRQGSKPSSRSTRARGSSSSAGSDGAATSRSAFSFGNGNAGVLVGAAVAGAAMGFAANVGRKLFVQFGAGAGDWLDALKAEHEAALAIFDKIEATDDNQVHARSQLLTKLKHALDKHATQEENVIYPALRQANSAHDADALNAEHGYVKTYLYELAAMPKDNEAWLARVRDFRAMIQEHMRMEEEQIFPAFRESLSDDQNATLTARMNREGFMVA